MEYLYSILHLVCKLNVLGLWTKLMVVGGHPNYNQVQMIDLSGQDLNCPQFPNYFGADYGSVGTYIKDKVMVCGGTLVDSQRDYTDRCYSNTNGVSPY